MIQEIYLIDNEDELKDKLVKQFKEDVEYKFKKVKTENLDIALKNIPALIIINEDTISEDVVALCNKVKENDDNNITPVIVVTSNVSREHRVEVLRASAEHFIKKPIDEEYMYYTIKNIVRLLYLNRRVSPLTGLPGNVQIQAEMKKRLLNHESFAMLYLDLDNFKAYNDVYGFFKGDEMIKFTARTIIKNVHSNEVENNFVGHIGGDDFVAIVSDPNYEIICQNIIAQFDSEVKKYFSKDDVEKGFIEVANRKGIIEEFPLTSISIGVVEVDAGRFANTLEIGEAGAQVKHLSKTIQGSTYVIDRRKHKEK